MKLARQPFRLNRIVFHADAPDEFLGTDDADAWRRAFGAPGDRAIVPCWRRRPTPRRTTGNSSTCCRRLNERLGGIKAVRAEWGTDGARLGWRGEVRLPVVTALRQVQTAAKLDAARLLTLTV